MTRTGLVLALVVLPATALLGQAGGDLVGRVRETSGRRIGIEGARVVLDASPIQVVTDFKGRFRFHAVPPGVHRLDVVAPGYAAGEVDSVAVLPDAATTQDVLLADSGGTSPPAPRATLPSLHRVQLARPDLADLPVSTPADVAALVPGNSGGSYWGGRPGEQVTVVDGVPVRNAYDASTAEAGLTLPMGLLETMAVRADAPTLSAAGALSGVTQVTPRTGGPHWIGTGKYEGDGLFSGAADQGYDHLSLSASGPLGHGARLAVAADGFGALQTQPHGAPTGDPLAPAPWELPHNSGSQVNAGLTLTLPFGPEGSLQLLGIRSVDQGELFEPTFKYDVGSGPGRRLRAVLAAAVLRHMTNARFSQVASLSLFDRDFEQGLLATPPSRGLGALSLANYQFVGDGIARSGDTATARGGQPEYAKALLAATTPWGVPEFSQANDPRGDLLWNHTREVRAQAGLTYDAGTGTVVEAQAGLAATHVTAFQRVLAYLGVQDSVPPATVAALSPFSASLGGSLRLPSIVGMVTLTTRVEATSPGSGGGMQLGISPTLALRSPIASSLTLEFGAAQLAQYPDFQFLAAEAFDDSLAPGHYRLPARGLGYEFRRELSLGLESEGERGSVRVGVVAASLADLVASDSSSLGVDSSHFANIGKGTVAAAEIDIERRITRDLTIDVGYMYEATSYDAASGFRQASALSSPLDQDRTHHFVLRARGSLPAGFRGGLVFQFISGAAYASPGGTDNTLRAPSQMTVNVRLLRELRLGGRTATAYIDVRNLLNRGNLVGVRRDDGQAGISAAGAQTLATAGYNADPNPIPYESPYYRASEDLNHNNMIDGAPELMPLYQAAAYDFGAPLAAYGPARQVRLGLELSF